MKMTARNFFIFAVAVVGGALAVCGEELHGVDTWAGIKPLPAVVNPVGREASPDVISLRGEWEFVTQPKAFCRRYRHTKTPFAKVDEQTPAICRSRMDTPWSEARKIHVPGAWEAQGVGEPGLSIPWDPLWDSSPKKINHIYMGEGWYRKDVVLPSGWNGKKVWLKIGGVKSQGWFWVNKHPVAWVDNYCGTYKYDITPFVKLGETNRLIVCVNNALPSRKGLMSNVHRWGGIYRDVELEATPATRIDDAWVRGDFDKREAELHVTVGGCDVGRLACPQAAERRVKDNAPYQIRFTVDGHTIERPILQSSNPPIPQSSNPPILQSSNYTLRLPLADFRPWSPEHPNLYWAKIELLDAEGKVVHSRRERFGVRKLEVRGDKFYLNNHPYFLRGFGDDSVYPITGMPPPDREVHLAHLKKARAAGFNFVRLHTHCEVPEYFEAADEVGILIQAELPYYTDVPTEAFTFDPLRDLRELQAHYRRYPSFAVYCGGNEGRLGPYVEKAMYAFVKRTDPDRLVNHQDGDRMLWQERDDDEGCNDVGNSDYDIGPRDVWPRGTFRTGRPFVCHEYLNLCVKQDTRLEPLYTGAWTAPDSRADRLAWLAARGLDAAWGDALQDAQHTLQGVYQKRGIEWARKDPYCGGYCFWTAVDVVVANGAIHSAQGLFDPFWQTKRGGLSPEQFARFNGPSCVLLDTPDENRVFTSGDTLPVDFLFAHFGDTALKDATLEWSLEIPSNPSKCSNRIPLGVLDIGSARKVAADKIVFPSVAKAVKAVLRAKIGGIANEWDFWVFPKRVKRDGSDIAADASLRPMLAKLYDGVADAASPEGAKARVVVAPYGSQTAVDALAHGKNVLTVSGWDGKPNVSLGWWSMGNQVGTALAKGHPALAGLPHEGALTPLLFRVVKEGALALSRKELTVASPAIVGEGKKDCFLYLGEIKTDQGRHMASFGLDILSGTPEGTAILDGIIDEMMETEKTSGEKAEEAECLSVPLPEHPRPDWYRKEWVNLNGQWDFGLDEGAYGDKITVPFGWGSALSGVKDVEGKDTGYYRRMIKVPVAWKGKRVFIVVGAADHDTEFLFDGKLLGRHVGGYTPFEFEITGLVKWGEEQRAEFKIWDPAFAVARANHYLFGKQHYGNVRGIWQTVYLEARGQSYFEWAHFAPNISNSCVRADLRLGAPAETPSVAKVEFDGKVVAVPFAKGEVEKSVDIAIARPRLWDLDNPHLYDVILSLSPESGTGELVPDEVRTYFGFREIGVGKTVNGDAYITLNGKPVYLQMCLDQSYHPDGFYTFPSDASMKNELLLSKRLALSGNRIHIKVEVPRKLYWADRLGLLIQADVPNSWGKAGDEMFGEHWKCFEEMVRRDFNHPSIYQWTLFNETWGLLSRTTDEKGGQYEDATKLRVAEACRKAKALDATRLVDDNSACNHDHLTTDVNTWHRYCPAYEWFDKLELVCEKTYPGSDCNYAAGYRQGDMPMMNAECGNVWGYSGATGDCDFTWDYHAMINAFRSHLKCCGWIYTEHHDVVTEWNGYVRADRSPKYDGMDALAGMSLADLHAKATVTFLGTRGREIGEVILPGKRKAIPVGVSFITDTFAGMNLALSARAWWYDGEGRKVEVSPKQIPGTFPAKSWQCEKLWDVEFDAPNGPACGCVILDLMADGKRIARNFWSFSTVARDADMVRPRAAEWSEGTAEVMGGLKLNGFGKGYFEYEIPAPKAGGVFRAELSAKRRNWKDRCEADRCKRDMTRERSANANSYPQTSDERFPANLTVHVNGKVSAKQVLADDPADHRGILSWLAQPHDRRLREAGSYGYLVEVPVPGDAVRDGKAVIRLESDAGLGVYGPRFGRYPIGPEIR